MLKKLKIKFIIATIVALVIVLTIIIGAINLFNYQIAVDYADDTLNLLMENSGKFPDDDELTDQPDGDLGIEITPETPFESRYFTVLLKNGQVISVDTESIAAVNDSQAIRMTRSAYIAGKARGFDGNYRFFMKSEGNKTRVLFLDCTKSLSSVNRFFISSIVISLMGIAAIFVFLWFASERIVAPFAAGYEKQKVFITNAGHDIKTPITIIDADAELLEIELGDNEWLKDIKKQTSRLASLTSDLIYLSRMEEQQSTPYIDFPISELIEEVVSSFGGPAKTKNITLTSSIPPALFYEGDESAIRKLITVILDNAIKYSPEGEVVDVDAKKIGRNVYIRISNVAPSVTHASLKLMFDRFYRSDEARSTAGGFGIGLSVASAIVAAHKGKISAEKQGDTLVIEIIL